MSDLTDVRNLSHAELRKVYEANQNVLRFCKEKLGSEATNEQAAIMHSYELQAGSYVKSMTDDADYRSKKEAYGKAVADVLSGFNAQTILEAGVGEATTLTEVVKNLPAGQGRQIYGFDLAWSRVLIAKNYFEEKTGRKAGSHFFAGELEHIALPDNSFDVVFTSHAIEPNHGREKEILAELYRVARGRIILFEPAFELASEAARERMQYHGYCRGLKDIALANGWHVERCELFGGREDAANPTMILVIKKSADGESAIKENGDVHGTTGSAGVDGAVSYISPVSGGTLTLHQGHYFNEEEGLVFPVLAGIPYLTRSAGLLASHYLSS